MMLFAVIPAKGQVNQGSTTSEQTPIVRKPRPPRLKAQMHRARTAFESGASLMEAMVRLERVLKDWPNDVEAHKLRARVGLALNRPESARKDAQRAVKLAPKDGEAYFLLAEAARREADTSVARQALERAAKWASDDASMDVRLAWSASQLGLLDQAEKLARKGLATDSSSAGAYYQLARVLVRKNKKKEAVRILEQGFQASLLSAPAIRRDHILRILTSRKKLQQWLK